MLLSPAASTEKLRNKTWRIRKLLQLCSCRRAKSCDMFSTAVCVYEHITGLKIEKNVLWKGKKHPVSQNEQCKPLYLNNGPLFSFYRSINTANHIEVCPKGDYRKGRKKIYLQFYKAKEINFSGNSLREQNK